MQEPAPDLANECRAGLIGPGASHIEAGLGVAPDSVCSIDSDTIEHGVDAEAHLSDADEPDCGEVCPIWSGCASTSSANRDRAAVLTRCTERPGREIPG